MERINLEDARIRVEFRKTETDEDFKEAFFYWVDNYPYKLLDSDILDLINRAKDAL